MTEHQLIELREYAFEYSEEQGEFHQNFGDVKEFTNGYKTVCHTLRYKWWPFSKMIRERYCPLYETKPSYKTFLEEWERYNTLVYDVKQSEKDFKELLSK